MNRSKAKVSGNVVFSAKDFQCFEERYRRSREHNRFRLDVRRKLNSLGASLLADLQGKGIEVVMRTSLHHPYTYNRFSVDSQWVYYSPGEDWQTLKEKLGPVGEDLDFHYMHTLLLVGIQAQGLFISLKIHRNAWWDGQNLKNKCKRRENRAEFLQLLKGLEKFCLRLDAWPNSPQCPELDSDAISGYFQYYTPGEHWFHLDCDVAKDDPLAMSFGFQEFAREKLFSLLPVYSFIRWKPDNNYVFQ